MQTTLLGLAIAFILALVAALVGPLFIDWTQFRPQFEAEASRVVGAPVRVGGTFDARLLPAPSLRLRSVTVGNANDPARIRADRLDVEFSLSSLRRGEWRATELSIGGAAADLGLNAQGGIELPAATGPFNLGALAIDRLNVTGRLALHDAASRSTLELTDIAFGGDVRSLAAGAMRGDGNFKLAGTRYPFRFSSGQTADSSGTRVRLTIDPGERPLSIDLDGILNFEARVPHFDGALTLASPLGLKIKNAGDPIPTPWRIATKVKMDPSDALFETIEASYGAEDRALRFAGVADMRFGASPLLHAVLSAKQLDADRLLAQETASNDPVMPLAALQKALAHIPHPPLATRLEVSAEQIMLGGRPLQTIGADLRADPKAWAIDRLELRAPGATRVVVSGGTAQPGGTEGFKGAVSIDSTDPDTLAAWLQGRSDVTFRSQKPLRIRGNLSSAADHLRLEALKAEIDGGTVEGRIDYATAVAVGGSRLDATLAADRLDIDAASALIRSLGGKQAEWPDAGQLSLDIGRAVSAGQEMRPFKMTANYSARTIVLDRLKVGDPGSLMIEGSGSFDRMDGTGQLAVNATSASTGQIATMLAPIAPAVAARLNAVTPAAGPARFKLALDLGKDPQRADRAVARAVLDVDLPQVKGTTTLTAAPTVASLRGADLGALSRSDISLDTKAAGQGRQLVALLGLGDAINAGDAPLRFEGSAAGAWQKPLRVTAKFSGAELDADMQGDTDIWTAQRKATVALAVRRANLAPLFDLKPTDPAVQAIGLSSKVTLNGDRLSFDDLDSTVAGARLRGRVALTMGTEPTVDGDLNLDSIELAPALGLAIGGRGREGSEPLARGLLHGWRGQLALQASKGVLPGGGELRPVSAVLKSNGQSLTVDAIKGKIGGGDLVADLDLRSTASGYAVAARVTLDGADATALRYRGLSPPAGKATLRLTLASQGRSAAALEGAVSGNGLLSIDGARIDGLNPKAFDIAIRASDTGQATDDAKLRQIVATSLSSGALALTTVQIPLEIKDSRLRISATTLDGDGARAILSGGFDMIADQADLRIALTGTAAGSSNVRPEIQIFAAGSPDRLERTIDVAALSSWLAVRAIDRETRRLDALEKGESAAIRTAVPPTETPAQDAPTSSAPLATAPTPSAPILTTPDTSATGRDARRPVPRLVAPRAVATPPAAVPPVLSQQIAPLPAPIEIRPAPGAIRTPRPRPAAPLVLTPPAATLSR
ncbi:MAG: AsmA-like C-terminal region-containing protein [Tardiphaga sp.]